jgi:hypothetical protein
VSAVAHGPVGLHGTAPVTLILPFYTMPWLHQSGSFEEFQYSYRCFQRLCGLLARWSCRAVGDCGRNVGLMENRQA